MRRPWTARGSGLVLLPAGGGVWGPNSVLALTLLGSVFGLSRTAGPRG